MRKEVFSSSALTLGISLAGFLGFIYAAYVGRVIGPILYADFGLALTLFYVLASTNTPLRNLLTNFTRKYFAEGSPHRTHVLLVKTLKYLIWITLIALPVLLGFLKPLRNLLNIQSAPGLIVVIFFMEALALILNAYRGIIAGMEKYWAYNTNFILEALLRIFLGTAILLFFPNAFGGVLAYPAAMILLIVFSRYQIASLPKEPYEPINTKEVRQYFFPLVLSSLFFSVLYSLDPLLAKIFLDAPGSVDAGFYMAASQISKFLYFIAISFNTIVINLASESAAKGVTSRKNLGILLAYYAVISSAVVAVIYIIGMPVISLSFGRLFADPGLLQMLWPMCIGVITSGISLILCHYLLGFRHYTVYIFPALAVILEFLLIFFWHNTGLSIAWMYALSQTLLAIVMISITIFHKPLFVQTQPYPNPN